MKRYFICLLGMLLFTCVNGQGLKIGEQPEVFKYSDMDDKKVSLDDLKGKYVYIDVWATWCAPCKEELPHLRKLEEKMHKKNIVFVSISIDGNKEDWKKMVKEKNLGGYQLHIGTDYSFLGVFGTHGIPRFILLDKAGKVLESEMTRPSNPLTLKKLKKLKGL